jgi:serine/threonine protein kinase
MDIKVSDVVCVVCNFSFIKNSKVILYIYLNMEQIYTRLKSDLIKQGFKIDDMFLQNLSIKNKEYIKNLIYNLPTFIHKKLNTIDTFEKKIVKYSPCGKKKLKVQIISFINKGSYNQVYHVVDLKSGHNYVYRFSNFYSMDDSYLINNFIETFIHSFLNLYQKRYLLINTNFLEEKYINNILNLRHFGFNHKIGLITTITDKMDGTLYEILSINNIILSQKIKILMKALFQITYLIEHLQEKFKFVHNDLKANNIFYKILDKNRTDVYNPHNLHFIISDFDASRIEIDNNIIIGNTYLSPDSSFNSRKDLFLLLNSLYYIFNSEEWILEFFGKFNLDSSIIRNQNNFNKLYKYYKYLISDIYEPSNFKKFLINLPSIK